MGDVGYFRPVAGGFENPIDTQGGADGIGIGTQMRKNGYAAMFFEQLTKSAALRVGNLRHALSFHPHGEIGPDRLMDDAAGTDGIHSGFGNLFDPFQGNVAASL